MTEIATDERGTAFIPVRVIISIIVGAAIVGVVFLGFQQAQETSAQSQVESECDTLTAKLSTLPAGGDARDLSNPHASRGDTCSWEPDLPSELLYLGLGVDPDPENNGDLYGGLTDKGNCIYYRVEGKSKQVRWLDTDIRLREGEWDDEDDRWTMRNPGGYIIEGGGEMSLTFELVEKGQRQYILIHNDDGFRYVDRVPPEIELTSHQERRYTSDGDITITWEASDDSIEDANVDIGIHYREIGENSWTTLTSGEDNDGEYEWAFPRQGRYKIKVTGTDGRNTGSDVSESISYQFPYTTLDAKPCYHEENAVWVKPASSISLDADYADSTHYRVWSERNGWRNWKRDSQDNPALLDSGKYYIEYYSTKNGLNESSPSWQHVNNKTIYVDDSPPASHAEVEGPQATNTETIHKPIDVVFLIDTSASMPSEWNGLCESIDNITSGVENVGVDFRYDIYGIGEGRNSNHKYGWDISDDCTRCATDKWIKGYYDGSQIMLTEEKLNRYGCHGTMESWGPGTAGVARFYSWRDDVVKVIVPMADEGPFWGEENRKSVTDAINECNARDIVVFPISGENCGDCVKDSMERLAHNTTAEGITGERYSWKSKTQVKNQLKNTIEKVTKTEVLAGSSTSATTIHINMDKSGYEVPATVIHYKIKHPDSETDWMTENPGEGVSLRIFAEGSHTIKFFAEDKLGRTEEIQEKTYYIDGTPPESTVNPPSKTLNADESLTIRATDVHDPEPGIGVAGVALCYRCNDGDWNFYEFDQEDPYRWNFVAPQSGNYEFASIAIDRVGNQEKGISDDVVPKYDVFVPKNEKEEKDFQLLKIDVSRQSIARGESLTANIEVDTSLISETSVLQIFLDCPDDDAPMKIRDARIIEPGNEIIDVFDGKIGGDAIDSPGVYKIIARVVDFESYNPNDSPYTTETHKVSEFEVIE